MKKIQTYFIGIIAFMMLLTSCSDPELPVVENMNLENYMGKWFEIAALPAGITKGCTCTSFNYQISNNGSYVMIINSCIKKGKQGAVLAKGFVEKESGGAKWEIELFWPFTSDYYILAVADDYSYAMAGSPDRKKLWILCRNPVMDSITYNSLIDQAQNLGFDTHVLIKTIRDCNMN